VVRAGRSEIVTGLASRLGGDPAGPWPEPVDAAAVLPVTHGGESQVLGVLVAGISARRAYDARYQDFLGLIASQLATAITNAREYEAERERAEALAQLDRAKTTFFSNVSHEFRTPLTLISGPIADLLREAAGPLTGAQREQVEIVQRNAGRLLKLVNALLDFSRIEAGRMQASYRLTDLAALTREMAAAFRAVIEHGGLRFDVRCEAIGAPVYVDRDMWEKIVLNLLSNAFKFTRHGAITVELRDQGGHASLTVRDTGIGIPEHEVTRVFERFHRVEHAQARTLEGSGIGLALTSELVRLHGGAISVDSRPGEGSAFTVRIPTGRDHLPQDRVDGAISLTSTAIGADAFVDEAERWLPGAPADAALPSGFRGQSDVAPAAERLERILVVDDNADMRDYLRQLLASWRVETAPDGAAALAAAQASPPDLIVTDVMMPRLDGFELLRALRADARTRAIPVLMLSARAGEEARVSGLSAGADDYITKPFAARELTARVRSLLALARARREAELQKRHLHSLFMQAPTPIVILRGADYVVELANPFACMVWGRREDEVLGRPLLDALPELHNQPFSELLDGVLRTGVPYVGKEVPARVIRGANSTPDTIYFNFVYAPLRGVDGAIEGILVIAFDVTDEVRARDEVEQLRSIAEEANRTKDEFLAILGHELRNPLAPILTALQLMTLRGDTAASRERTVIDRQVRHLVRLVDDLLDVSRIARGRIELRRRPVELAEIVTAAVEGTSPVLEERQHQLHVDVPASGLMVNGDVTRLTQVVVNVLTNAAKYTEPRGRISVSAEHAGGQIALRVRDTGVGIPEELLPKVFEMFAQGRQTLDRSQGGLGLGLTIVRSLVALHGGTVDVRSEGAGQGSEFIIRLPALAAAAPDDAMAGLPGDRTAHGRPAYRILVVDDNVDAAHLIAEALEAIGHDTRIAFDGPAALDVASAFQPGVALLDLGLPLMDGYELARQLAATPSKPPVLVAITGYGQPSDLERTRAAGFAAHVVKPVDVQQLAALLDQLMARHV
jgi:signal transduction histidine kinase/DNA-binding response OmpR family regulator